MSVSARLHPALLHLTAVALGYMKFVTCKAAERWIEGTVGESLYNGKEICGRVGVTPSATKPVNPNKGSLYTKRKFIFQEIINNRQSLSL